MTREPDEQSHSSVLSKLIHLLHGEATAEDFVVQLAQVELLPIPAHKKSTLIENIRMAMAVQNRLELQQKREHGLLAVMESAYDLSRHLDLTELLRATASKARNLLGSDVAWISIYNPEIEKIQVKVADGAVFQDIDRMTARKGLGLGSVVIETGLPFTTSDYLSDNRFEHDDFIDATFRSEGVASLVGVPLIADNEVVGLLFVADRYHRSHTAIEVSILSTLATHAAVAFTTAQAFNTTKMALEKSDTARAELEEYAVSIHSAAEAHEQLTSLIAQGASLSTLCETVAQLLGGCIVVVDEALQLICRATDQNYTGDGGKNYDPYGDNSISIEKAVRESRLDGRSVIAYNNGDELCRIISVIAGNDVVGAVLLYRHKDLDEISIRTYERTSSVIGIVLLSQERIELHQNRDSSALLRGLLLPHEYEWASTVERAHQFDISLSQSLSLVLIESDDLNASYIAKRLRAMQALSGVVLNEIDGAVGIVCKTSIAQELVQNYKQKFINEFRSIFRGVLSKPVPTAQALPETYNTLRRALFITKRLGVTGILNQNELALYSILFETHDRTSLNSFLESTIGALLAYDRNKNSELTTTLLRYFDSNRNASLVAKHMSIHVNTVRQRINTIEGLIGHLGNPTRALETHMALRLWALEGREKLD